MINNVLSFASVPIIMDKGAALYRDFGMGKSRGTMPISSPATSSTAACSKPPSASRSATWSMTSAAEPAAGRPVRAVRSASRSAPISRRALFDTPFDYEAFAARDGLIGHGGIVVFDDTVDMAKQARFAMEFCAIERAANVRRAASAARGMEVIDRIIGGGEFVPPRRRCSKTFVIR